jgi:signal transduction histidine kinase
VAARAEDAVRAEYVTRRARSLFFGAFAAFVAVALAFALPRHPALDAAGAVVSLAAGVLLAHARPRAMLAVAGLAAAGVAALGSGQAGNVGWFAVCVLAGWTVLAGGRWVGLAFWAGSLLLFGGEALADHDPGWAAWAIGTTATTVATLAVMHERALVTQLRAAQAGLAERSRAEERSRIARELHDVIAHSLTVSLLHISSARLAVEYDPADAARALDEAERLGRASLNEVRSIVGMSGASAGARAGAGAGAGAGARAGAGAGAASGEAIAAPAPGIDTLGELVDQLRRAGADVSLTIEGNLERAPATTGSTVYRIVQESLTNAAKHAPGSPVTVRVIASPGDIELTVDSAGAPGTGAGMGLTTMRERAEAVGGRCAAGPHGTGWRVQATLPIAAASERARA